MILSFIDLKAEDIELNPAGMKSNSPVKDQAEDQAVAQANIPVTTKVTDEVHERPDESSGPRNLFELKYLLIREKVEKARFERELLARPV